MESFSPFLDKAEGGTQAILRKVFEKNFLMISIRKDCRIFPVGHIGLKSKTNSCKKMLY